MNKKNITINFRKYLDDFLESIDNRSLRDRLRKNIIVTGGSIVSSVLDEEINDYDIYIKDKKVLIEISNYLIDKLCEREGYERSAFLVLHKDHNVVIEALKLEDVSGAEDYNNGSTKESKTTYHIGGIHIHASMLFQIQHTFRNHSDRVKIFMLNDFDKYFKKIKKIDKDNKYIVKNISSNAITLSDKIQIIVRFYGDYRDIHKNFDFVHATNYFTFNEGVVLQHDAMEAILSKDLKYIGSKYPLASLFRMKKFIERGWKINAGEIVKIAMQLNEMNLLDELVLEEQLTGVDMQLFGEVIDRIRGFKKDSLTSETIIEIINDVFNHIPEDDYEYWHYS